MWIDHVIYNHESEIGWLELSFLMICYKNCPPPLFNLCTFHMTCILGNLTEFSLSSDALSLNHCCKEKWNKANFWKFKYILIHITVADPCRNRNGDCEHKCINNNGNRLCECYAGYKLSSDQRHCEGKLRFNPEVSYDLILRVSYHLILRVSYHLILRVSYHLILRVSYHLILRVSYHLILRVIYQKLLFYSQDKLSFDHEGMVSYCLIISVIQVTILSKGKLRFNFVHSVFG